jgi:hypothetical protein
MPAGSRSANPGSQATSSPRQGNLSRNGWRISAGSSPSLGQCRGCWSTLRNTDQGCRSAVVPATRSSAPVAGDPGS